MSTYWGYACESHDPPLISEHWINHGDDKLAALFYAIRRGEWPNDPNITSWDQPIPLTYYEDGYGSTAPIDWLHEHPHCRVVLHNEYGDTKPIGEVVSGSLAPAALNSAEPA